MSDFYPTARPLGIRKAAEPSSPRKSLKVVGPNDDHKNIYPTHFIRVYRKSRVSSVDLRKELFVMATVTIDEAKKGISGIKPNDQVAFIDPLGRVRIGTVRFKGEGKKYVYAQYRAGDKVSEKYIGKRF